MKRSQFDSIVPVIFVALTFAACTKMNIGPPGVVLDAGRPAISRTEKEEVAAAAEEIEKEIESEQQGASDEP